MSFLIRVPATTANLGPGFDCLGLALDLWNEVEVSSAGEGLSISIQGEGQDELPTDETNLTYCSMKEYALRHQKSLPEGIQMVCRNQIPLTSGLGSSSAAIVSGILAAAAILEIPLERKDQLECAARIEGHPDNVAPCILGGLVASSVTSEQAIAINLPIASLPILIIVPEFKFPTPLARAVLPKSVPFEDAIFNLGRMVFLSEALKNADLELLSSALQDKLHQPYRIPMIPGAESAISAAQRAGAAGVVLSGAGPSLLVFLRSKEDQEKISSKMVAAFSQAGLRARVFSPKISSRGASIEPLDP
ncbi:MAG: homoserine kinase [Chloroflexi bacterium]|nr:homoserine kinase [Chloroflexota bacterium]